MSASLSALGRLLHWLDSERDRQLDFLRAFTRIDTCNPPGDTTQAADLFRQFLDAEGIAHRTEAPQPSMPNLIASFAGGAGRGRHLVLNGHLDVFPVGDRAAWSRDPFFAKVIASQKTWVRRMQPYLTANNLGSGELAAAYKHFIG